ncbi:dirigent protein 17-like isoform X2 [Humulus lupulus]|nr:dirigent protein 17-like isoform X2 [Humulus lupulus]
MMSDMVGNGKIEKQEIDSSSTVVFEIPGEPAVIINGMPDVCPTSDNFGSCTAIAVAESNGGHKGFGEWLEGREVQKLFGEHYYTGVVTEYDTEAGWYRVVYEDGDFEDLDWNELEEVLKPLDIMVPLKTLALKTIRRSKKHVDKTGVKAQTHLTKSVARKGKRALVLVPEGDSLMQPQ